MTQTFYDAFIRNRSYETTSPLGSELEEIQRSNNVTFVPVSTTVVPSQVQFVEGDPNAVGEVSVLMTCFEEF